MKRMYKFLLVICIFSLFKVESVFASLPEKLYQIQQVGGKITYDKITNNKAHSDLGTSLKKNIYTATDGFKNYNLFCTAYSKKSPAAKGIDCPMITNTSNSNYWSDEIKAGVAAIIDYFKIDNSLEKANEDYIKEELSINAFLCKYKYNNNSNNPSCQKDGISTSVVFDDKNCTNKKCGSVAQSRAKEAYDKVHNKINLKSLRQSSSGDYYTISGVVENAYNSNYTINISGISSSDYQMSNKTSTSFSYKIPKSKLKEGDTKVTVSLSQSIDVPIAANYDCTSAYQTLTINYTENKNVTQQSNSLTITLTKKTTTSLVVKKVDKSTKNLISSSASFKLYKGSCNNISNASAIVSGETNLGQVTFNNLTYGDNYALVETKAPKGYIADATCHDIKIDSYNKVVTIENKLLGCPDELEILKTNGYEPKDLIDLYKKYDSKYNNLLNFNNPSCTVKNCSSNYSKTSGCFSGSYVVNGFNENDLSCYTDTSDVLGLTAYCASTFSLDNYVGTDWETKSGQLIFQTPNGHVFNIKVVKECYLYGDTNVSSFASGDYSDYIKNVEINFDGDIVNLSYYVPGGMNTMFVSQVDKSNYYKGTLYGYYYLPRVYAENGAGTVYTENCPNCKFLGYGLITKLYNNKTSFNFKFNFINSYTRKTNSTAYSGTCNYKIEDEIVEGNNLELKYRGLSSDGYETAFPGKSGNIRKVGNNWCSKDLSDITYDALTAAIESNEFDSKYDLNKDGLINSEDLTFYNWALSNSNGDLKESCSYDNVYARYALETTPNSYGVIPSTNQKVSPKYVITLTPERMKEIKNYNSYTSYDDYNLNCSNEGNVCISNYLSLLMSKGVVSINNSDKRN